MSIDKRTVIIGNGGAGAEGIKALRENGYTGEIHLFSNNSYPIYNPMLSTYYASDKMSFEHLFPYGNDDNFYKEYQVEVHLGSPVTALNAEKRVASNQDGLEIAFDQCLIASGASPFLPPIEGINSPQVFTMRTVEDAIRLKNFMETKPQKALVVGASMVGIKLVELFYNAGMDVCLADLAGHVFPLAAHRECAAFIEKRLSEKGIKLRFNAGLTKIEEKKDGLRVYFESSEEAEDADLLVMCIGVRANLGFIDRKQIEVKQGILVDEQLKTNVPYIYAAGDAAQGTNVLTGEKQIIGLWANARCQGRTAGKNMAGITDTYLGNILHNITHFMNMDFVGLGDVIHYSRTEKIDKGNSYIQLFWQDGILSGANFVDAYHEAGVLRYHIAKGLRQMSIGSYPSSKMVQHMLIESILKEVEEA